MNDFVISKNLLFGLGVLIILSGVIFSSFYKLSESPVTWTDEGLIVQTSKTMVERGVYGFQVAPTEIISPSFISTSFPVTFPITLSFHLFGVSLLHARLVMAMYIIALFLAVFLLFRDKIKEVVLWTLFLIGSFPPLYGHGKNVLGEVPGLFLLLLSAFFLKSTQDDQDNLVKWSLFGLFFGLSIATKPIFILTAPAFIFVVYKTYIKDKSIQRNKLGVLFIFSLLPVLVWLNVQFFSSDSWSSVVSYYGNPHALDVLPAAISNLKDFISHTRTLFAGAVFLFWSFILGYMYYTKKHIPLYESYLYIVSFFVLALYFRNPPYYRYFFIAEVLSLIFLAFNLFRVVENKLWLRNIARVFLMLLVVFQLGQLYSGSWVADGYKSTRTTTMESVISKIAKEKEVFVYHAPEAVIFLQNFNSSQYFSGTVSNEFGQGNLHFIKDRNDLLIITRKDLFLQEQDLFSGYHITKEFDRYVLATK